MEKHLLMKDEMSRFRPMSEEEQKNLLYIVLDCMDDIMDNAERKGRSSKADSAMIQVLTMVVTMMTEASEMEREIGFSVSVRERMNSDAEGAREAWDSRKGRA